MQDNVRQTHSGVDIVDSAGKTFKEIADAIKSLSMEAQDMQEVIAKFKI